MNRHETVLTAIAPVELERETGFALGGIKVSPSLREVCAGGKTRTVEPRVMQVLVALARADGAVVSRGALIETCWSGRIVGDDAVNRCVAKVRELARLSSEPSFEVETIPRVGYRLKPADSMASFPAAADPVAPSVAGEPVLRPGRTDGRWIGIGLAALTFVVGAAGAWLLSSRPPARWEVERSELLVATSLNERHPAISPDGKLIAYSAGADIESRKIYLHRISGGEALRLTNDRYDDASPSWSPDGKQIAYVAYRAGEPCHLMAIQALAGAPRELARCQTDERSQVVWSPTDGQLFFPDRPDTKSVDRIMRFDIASLSRGELTHPPSGSLGDGEIAVSPDGRWGAFVRHISSAEIQRIVLDLHSGAERVLTDTDSGGGAAWSNDSRNLFVDTADGTDFALWAYPIDGGRPSHILSSPEEMSRLSLGPHGLLAVEVASITVDLARSPATAGGAPVFLDSEKGFDGSPDIAPDGTVAAQIWRPQESAIELRSGAGALRKLVDIPNAQTSSEPRWSPDGSLIAFLTFIGNSSVIRVVTRTGAGVATVPLSGRATSTPAWGADGRSLIFPSLDTQGWRLWRVDVARPSKPTPLPYSGFLYIRMRGNELYGVRYDMPGVWRIDGHARRITQRPATAQPNEWTIVGNEIAYVDDAFGAHRQILAQPIQGGPARVMAQVPNYIWTDGFAVDPADGSVIYSAKVSQDDDIELLHLVKS